MTDTGVSTRRKRGRAAADNPSTGSTTKKRKITDNVDGTNDAEPADKSTARGGGGRSKTKSFTETLTEAMADENPKKRAPKRTKSEEALRKDVGDKPANWAFAIPPRRDRTRPSVPTKTGSSVYDIPGSDGEELATSTTKTKKKRATAKLPRVPDATVSKKGGRTAYTMPDTTNDDEADMDRDADELAQLEESPSKSARRARPTTTGKNAKTQAAVTKAKTTKKKNPRDEAPVASPQPKRQGARTLADNVAGGSPAVLKSILTPSRRRNDDTPRQRKNVAFGGADKDVEIFFEDLPTTKKKAKPAESTLVKQVRGRPRAAPREKPVFKPLEVAEEEESGGEDAEEEDDDDDEVCEICLKPDSNPPNEILFCDNCDLGFHQKCHNVPVVPEGDWLCKNCSQEDASKTPQKSSAHAAAAAAQAVPVTADAPDIPNLDRHLATLQRVLLDRCTGRKRLTLTGLDDAHGKVEQLVEQTIAAGEGNSMLLVGGRGVGKTTLVEEVISTMSEKYKGEFHVVRLNGFIHTDDKLALRDTWRQLGKEMEVDDDIVHRTNYADTMASLLALLSHPSEITGEDHDAHVTSQAVVFVIDEFDMFAYHPRQTLLYNLFDIAQSRKAPIAVLGCTTRVDVVEMLEKRVKSRFSHRYVFVPPPRGVAAYWEVCRQGLLVRREDARGGGMDTELEGHEEFMEYWSKKIERLYKQEAFQKLLRGQFYQNKSVMSFLSACILPLAALSPTNLALQIPPPRTASSGAAGHLPSLSAPLSKLHLLRGLSDLDLALLIAAARLDIVAHAETVNFAMAYDEYTSLVGRQRVQSASSGLLALGGGVRVWGRGVAGMAWERLVDLGLLVPSGIGGGGGGGKGAGGVSGLEGKMWVVDVALEEIPLGVKLSSMMARWCKEI